jgi:S-adenosylmethionine-diacylgycerolhomoserine-N-methlytransferase
MTETHQHAGLMDAVYRRQRHIYDATRKYFLLGRDRLIAELDPPPGGSVLEVGCGTGRNLVRAARAYPQASFAGLDISTAMLETARGAVERAGLAQRIALGFGDATSFDAQALFGRPGFDRVAFPYSLSMIPDWRGALAAGWAATAPGGRLMLVDFGDQQGLPTAFRDLLGWWLAKFHVAPRLTLPQDLAQAAPGAAVRFTPLYRGYAWLLSAEKPRGA